jgi:nicotinamide-nucleotide amidase
MPLRCEVVAVGTELLLGQIQDTNSSWIGEQLALSGIDSLFQTKVGDNLGRIVDTIRTALDRSDAVIICGGLGPTHDDITRDAIAQVMGVPLVEDEVIVDVIRAMFESRGRAMPEINRRQAEVPVGAAIIEQRRGTAPGLICPVGAKVIFAVPGVPHEMREMVERAILPDLRRRSGDTSVIISRTLRTWGESESGLNERLQDLIDRLDERGNPTLAFLASGIEGLKVRLTAKSATTEQARALIDAEEAEVRRILGPLVFGVDDDTMESVVLDLCRQRGLTLGLAESLTGGLVASRITAVAGASEVFRGSIVSYASSVKFAVLGLPEDEPVVSPEAALAMARGAQRVLGAEVALGLTGVAGPASQEGRPIGTVHVAAVVGDRAEVRDLRLPGDRDQIRQFACISGLDVLRQLLLSS